MTTTVLVLNAGYEELHRVPVQHAVRMLVRQVAVVEKAVPGRTIGPYPYPAVLRLVRYVKMAWLYRRRDVAGGRVFAGAKDTWTRVDRDPTFSFEGVLARDHHQCAFCGLPGADTVDHVLPRAQGGRSTWENCVAAHGSLTAPFCNSVKADRTPEQAGMPLLWQPFVPTVYDLTWAS